MLLAPAHHHERQKRPQERTGEPAEDDGLHVQRSRTPTGADGAVLSARPQSDLALAPDFHVHVHAAAHLTLFAFLTVAEDRFTARILRFGMEIRAEKHRAKNDTQHEWHEFHALVLSCQNRRRGRPSSPEHRSSLEFGPQEDRLLGGQENSARIAWIRAGSEVQRRIADVTRAY